MESAADRQIRAVHPDDVPALVVLLNLPGVRHGTLRLPFTGEDFVRKRMLGAGPNVHSVVGLLDGALVASAALICNSGRCAHCAEVALSVHDDHWGRGIGRRMMEALLDLADNWLGLRRVELSVVVDNARAIRLYTGLGFVQEGTQRAAILRDGRLVDTHMMARLREAPPLAEGGGPP